MKQKFLLWLIKQLGYDKWEYLTINKEWNFVVYGTERDIARLHMLFNTYMTKINGAEEM